MTGIRKDKLQDIINSKSVRIEFITWRDMSDEDNYAFLMMHGKQYNAYKKALVKGDIELQDFGLFYKGKGSRPQPEELEMLKEVFGEENFRFDENNITDFRG